MNARILSMLMKEKNCTKIEFAAARSLASKGPTTYKILRFPITRMDF